MIAEKKLPELLAPAGNMERLQFAVHYGADAVYCGGKRLSLRAFAQNFSIEELTEACQYVHERGKKLYVTLNAYMQDPDFDGLPKYIRQLEKAGVDAVIVSDPGALVCVRESAPEMELHLSTQANTLNSRAAKFWHSMGVKRIITARELSLDRIKEMRDAIPPDLELEVFVHGAMCISYSGRCLLSKVMQGRDGNRGACAQPCRYRFEMRGFTDDKSYYPIEQDEQGTYVLNSRDLNMIAHIDELMQAGVSSLKIEGRMKTAFYVASVVNAYKMALDDWQEGRSFNPVLQEELDKLRHRPYTTGFFLSKQEERETMHGSDYLQTHDFVAVVLRYDEEQKRALVEQRNRFFSGDTLELISPRDVAREFVVQAMFDENGTLIESAPHPKQKVWLEIPEVQPLDILRRRIQ